MMMDSFREDWTMLIAFDHEKYIRRYKDLLKEIPVKTVHKLNYHPDNKMKGKWRSISEIELKEFVNIVESDLELIKVDVM
jgi:pyruvate-formate lyase-activating enzyme